jgi:hypothetical protein
VHNLRLDRLDGRSVQQNFRVIGQHMDSEHYIRWTYPQDVMVEQGVVAVAARGQVTQRDHYIDMPDALTTNIHWKFARPEQWLDGSIETLVLYTGSTSSTNTFLMSLRAMRYSLGSNISTTGPTVNAALLVPGPAVANDELEQLWTGGYTPISPEWRRISWVLTRTGGNANDTNTGAFRLLAIRHRYIPNRHEV